MGEFCDVICFEAHSDGEPLAVPIIDWLCESGKAGHFVHFVTEGFRQWEILCALEQALIDTRQQQGWVFVVGHTPLDEEVKGWLEYEDWAIVPYGPLHQQCGSDVGLWRCDDFYDSDPVILARTPAADESGIHVNRQLKLGKDCDESHAA
jgi:hypothetical protein